LKEKETKAETLAKARARLDRVAAKAAEEWWSPSSQRALEEARRAVARAQKRLETEGGQSAMDLLEEEAMSAPDAFR
jgi:hypothetical protein